MAYEDSDLPGKRRLVMTTERFIESRDPAQPDSILGSFPLATREAVDVQIRRAHTVARDWEHDAGARAGALHAWANAIEADAAALIDTVTREVGKPIRESRSEVARAIAIIRYYAQAAYEPIAETYPGGDSSVELTVHRRPHGVISAICPWNFPVAIPAWKIAPALAYGNAVLFRPSSRALVTASIFARTAAASMPEGVLQVVVSDHDASAALVDDPRVGAVTFTGSVPIGMEIVRRVAGRGAPVQAEMGGQNASIVLADADLELAATTIAHSAMDYAGQKCTATRRAIIHRSIAAEFVPMLASAVADLRVGLPADEATDIGPVISEDARRSVETAVERALQRGAVALTDTDGIPDDGWYLAPTLLEIDDPTDEFTQAETFGPAAAVLVADSDEHALQLANATPFGLSGAVFSSDISRARSLATRLETGLQRVNSPTTGADFYVPFGGEKASGYGAREQGRAAREFFTHTRTMLVHTPR
jgi:acyl-CoA reductase-like NAD-dependent aldehyde dehydrogenase